MKTRILFCSSRNLSRLLAGTRKNLLTTLCLFFLLAVAGSSLAYAQPGAHDPTRIIRNVDGRYWIFTTGQGIYAMSSSNPDFTNFRVEPTPFGNSWPSWISNYVTGFNGHFWAPDIAKIGSTYYLYYSCAGEGAAAAIGVATATNLAGPWTDRGMVVAGNNAIDPEILIDGGNMWMSWGNWQSGIDIVQLNMSTGKRLNSSMTHLVSGEVEGPAMIKNGSYYYLFYQRGLCCNGVNSTYYVVVARSTSPTGPYTNERVFLQNRNGNIIGPGHVGYGEGRLTYHFYDGNDGGRAKLMVTTLGWSNGWPVAGGTTTTPPPSGSSTYYQLRNRGTGLFLDGMGLTSNGSACAQYANTTHVNSQWERISSGSYYQLRNRGTGLFLDGMGRTANGADVGQWANTTHVNSQWSVQQYSGNYYRIQNRGTGLFLDGMGRTANGSACGQYGNTTHVNAQWELIPISGGTAFTSRNDELKVVESNESGGVNIYPNPTSGKVTVTISESVSGESVISVYDSSGKLKLSESTKGTEHTLNVEDLAAGIYILKVKSDQKMIIHKMIKK